MAAVGAAPSDPCTVVFAFNRLLLPSHRCARAVRCGEQVTRGAAPTAAIRPRRSRSPATVCRRGFGEVAGEPCFVTKTITSGHFFSLTSCQLCNIPREVGNSFPSVDDRHGIRCPPRACKEIRLTHPSRLRQYGFVCGFLLFIAVVV